MISSERGTHKKKLRPDELKRLLRLCEPGQPFPPGPACHALGMQAGYPVLLKYAAGEGNSDEQIRLGPDVPARGQVDTLVFEVTPGARSGELGHLSFEGKVWMSSTLLLAVPRSHQHGGNTAGFASMPCGMMHVESESRPEERTGAAAEDNNEEDRQVAAACISRVARVTKSSAAIITAEKALPSTITRSRKGKIPQIHLFMQ